MKNNVTAAKQTASSRCENLTFQYQRRKLAGVCNAKLSFRPRKV